MVSCRRILSRSTQLEKEYSDCCRVSRSIIDDQSCLYVISKEDVACLKYRMNVSSKREQFFHKCWVHDNFPIDFVCRGILVTGYYIFSKSIQLEQRHAEPIRNIPSQRWAPHTFPGAKAWALNTGFDWCANFYKIHTCFIGVSRLRCKNLTTTVRMNLSGTNLYLYWRSKACKTWHDVDQSPQRLHCILPSQSETLGGNCDDDIYLFALVSRPAIKQQTSYDPWKTAASQQNTWTRRANAKPSHASPAQSPRGVAMEEGWDRPRQALLCHCNAFLLLPIALYWVISEGLPCNVSIFSSPTSSEEGAHQPCRPRKPVTSVSTSPNWLNKQKDMMKW